MKSTMGVLRSEVTHISAKMPPTMVLKVLPPTPRKKRAASMPANESVIAQKNEHSTNKVPVAMKTGRRPLISENGASIMGAMAKPAVKMVMPTV